MDIMKYVDWDNCSTILVGKNASATGKVIIAHGEDDPDCISQIHIVPAATHKEGEVLTFADGDAVVPQVPQTYRYMWSEMRSPAGEPFADGFMNEWGVIVASNACVSTKESKLPHGEGLGYGLRRLIAERCKTAREGVQVAAGLLDTFGYRSTRSYRIVDKDEAWLIQATVGNQYAAQRVGDDEVLYIPNWLTIHNIDFTDTEHKNFFWSENLVKYAIDNGWYTPEKEDYSDFDFAKTYQGDGYFVKSNLDRSDLAWTLLTGEKKPYTTFSVKAEKKYTLNELKEVLRAHYVGHEEDLKEDPTMSPHRYGICRDTTVESFVVEFDDEADLTVMWRANLRPCTNPMMPWFAGNMKSPKGFSWLTVPASQNSHFSTDPSEFEYKDGLAYWAFHMLAFTMEYNYKHAEDMVRRGIKEMEDEWEITVPAIKAAYKAVKGTNPDYARSLLTDYTAAQAARCVEFAKQMTMKIVNQRDTDNRNYWRKLYFGS